MTARSECLEALLAEADMADARYGPYTSSHEALGVITEEYQELVDAVRANDLGAIRREALQLGAAALRCAECCQGAGFRERSRKEAP
jgi:NTP pyrophosphatase (non-canonical NTP hydrolase)